MADCCEDKACAVDALGARQSGTLKTVLGINAVMFIVELVAGLSAGSTALLSDALDNLGDALTYGASLYAVGRGTRAKARVAVFKGFLILCAGLYVLGMVIYRILVPGVPVFETMGAVSILALAANGTCLGLLWKHRAEDINMSSVWECSRNDIASNIAVFIAAGAVWITGSGWPDLAIGAALAVLFLRSALRVLRAALGDLRRPPAREIRMAVTGRR
ncbi:MAG TPA: cation transporter [Burkholderiales bacterium]|nr:cation transporter [Burkholderiales bacterium]